MRRAHRSVHMGRYCQPKYALFILNMGSVFAPLVATWRASHSLLLCGWIICEEKLEFFRNSSLPVFQERYFLCQRFSAYADVVGPAEQVLEDSQGDFPFNASSAAERATSFVNQELEPIEAHEEWRAAMEGESMNGNRR